VRADAQGSEEETQQRHPALFRELPDERLAWGGNDWERACYFLAGVAAGVAWARVWKSMAGLFNWL
jgi:hypothetical protein